MRVKLKDIGPNPANPRLIRDKQFADLKRSIAQFPAMLQKRPIAITREGKKNIAIGGNQRTRALFDLQKEMENETAFMSVYSVGQKEVEILTEYFSNGVPVVDCTDLSPDEQRRFIIADNLPFGEWDTEALANEWDVEELQEWGMPEFIFGGVELNSDDFGTGFQLPEGDKEPFQQMTFTFSDEQANEIKDAIAFAKSLDEYGGVMTNGNENSNGNALYLIVSQWAGQKKLL